MCDANAKFQILLLTGVCLKNRRRQRDCIKITKFGLKIKHSNGVIKSRIMVMYMNREKLESAGF